MENKIENKRKVKELKKSTAYKKNQVILFRLHATRKET